MIRKSILVFFSLFILAEAAWGQYLPNPSLYIDTDDLYIEQRYDGGFHLFIRKKPGIGSVLITETTRDPTLQADNYAYRASEWNPINGDEIRILDGSPLPQEGNLYSLISSRTENHPVLGEAFHIFVPWILHYGYENTRHGEVDVANGTYLNLRAFSLPYGDYRGTFSDNPFVIQALQRPSEGIPGNYSSEAVASFSEISNMGGGSFLYAADPEDLVDMIRRILEAERGKSVDIVICLDTTESMKNDIDGVRRMLTPMLQETVSNFTDWRIGMVLYKDYYDEYLNRVIPFTKDFALFQRNLNAIQVRGGGDIPEAVYEALYEGATKFSWEAESRLMILIGDAPPHPRQRGRISQTMVEDATRERNIKVSAILLPQ
ncbi:MAG: VWA domain-containing protein [Treponema sp.]|jgi:hypothetical protein|nr:VWA domain-containing protein [Treponema sp.]